MAKLVILSEALKGTSHDLKVDRTTIGRLEDNTFQIADASISSHHCEILLKGADVVIKDLDSTNGTFVNNEKITEATLKPGQPIRLGQIDLMFEAGAGAAPPPGAPSSSASAPAQKPIQNVASETMVIQRGVSLSDLEKGPVAGLDTSSEEFAQKSNQVNRYFVIGFVLVVIAIIILIVFAALSVK